MTEKYWYTMVPVRSLEVRVIEGTATEEYLKDVILRTLEPNDKYDHVFWHVDMYNSIEQMAPILRVRGDFVRFKLFEEEEDGKEK